MAEERKTTDKPAGSGERKFSRPSGGSYSGPKRPFGKRRFESRRKVCKACVEKIATIDYKDVQFLRNFTMESGKILSRRITGACAKHQRQITSAVKRNRNLSILPYSNK
ncbi:MAG: 30S ribosomal protein S18 [Elusimicrobiaceae bacterium]|jgi:small subunit ribosomal protein S18|nr:30S ribosomal protein S18 [Elusimicrobiaceae bacterium]MBT3955337.1 30S ribosomal protein S18 [Elusimicrobiaceae bacterium]MBT4008473.1 30S ribosomal protein S18 [Elusimicrobiaceae bacterium]MBT4403361.1 30S ribosomal protein S18 [Elusimicrobiaceae bacterium]MBT4440202.1 30S ribosomal protein S18 [Elusimicrobiaceae bacterium]